MEEKKKKKKKYYYQYQQNKNYYYYRKKKRKNNEKKENILLSNNNNNNTLQIPEEDIVPIRKEDMHNSMLLKNILKISFISVLLIVVVFKVSYSFFTYQKTEPSYADIRTGEVYVKLLEQTTSINLNRMYPEIKEEARERNDNYFEFTIKAKNTSLSNVIYYNIDIENGNNISGRTRIDPKYIRVDLQEEVDGNYYYIQENVKLNEYNFIGVVPVNTNKEIVKRYRVRLWISDEIIISDYLDNAAYTQSEYNNLYANYSIKINSYDGKQ